MTTTRVRASDGAAASAVRNPSALVEMRKLWGSRMPVMRWDWRLGVMRH